MKIALDTQGGDKPPEEIVRGGIEFTQQSDSRVIFVGDENVIRGELRRHPPSIKHLILHAPEVIAMKERPLQAIRQKRDSSLVRGLEAVKKKTADAFVSPGNTGAVMAASLFLLQCFKTIKRPGIAFAFPTRDPLCGKYWLLMLAQAWTAHRLSCFALLQWDGFTLEKFSGFQILL